MNLPRANRPIALCAVLGFAGCVVDRTEQIAPPEQNQPVIGVNEASWRVTSDGELVGFVRRYATRPDDQAAPGEAGVGPWFAVQNPWSQELGMIDELGRAWRLRPHRSGPEWVGTGTIVDGVAEVLDLSGEIFLEPLESADR